MFIVTEFCIATCVVTTYSDLHRLDGMYHMTSMNQISGCVWIYQILTSLKLMKMENQNSLGVPEISNRRGIHIM